MPFLTGTILVESYLDITFALTILIVAQAMPVAKDFSAGAPPEEYPVLTPPWPRRGFSAARPKI
jgi:hypothetical protein